MNGLLIALFTLAGAVTAQTASRQSAAPDYSGMYAFLQEGEFLQLTVEDNGVVTGFVSRYSDPGANHKTFVDHFFKQARLDGTKLVFTTEIAQNVSYEFNGIIERGEGKKPGDEAYYVLKGSLTQYKIESDKKTTPKKQPVELKSFPQDVDLDTPK